MYTVIQKPWALKKPSNMSSQEIQLSHMSWFGYGGGTRNGSGSGSD